MTNPFIDTSCELSETPIVNPQLELPFPAVDHERLATIAAYRQLPGLTAQGLVEDREKQFLAPQGTELLAVEPTLPDQTRDLPKEWEIICQQFALSRPVGDAHLSDSEADLDDRAISHLELVWPTLCERLPGMMCVARCWRGTALTMTVVVMAVIGLARALSPAHFMMVTAVTSSVAAAMSGVVGVTTSWRQAIPLSTSPKK